MVMQRKTHRRVLFENCALCNSLSDITLTEDGY
ncbi:hypothetical protein SAMN06265795_1319 [Noviherbaspirillum humi]|uniref:Uncharacterized protein n=1 Tax=Noviherbaspirillum humi TaxID=1688639 RepID=A0A239M5I5_9BURK|nr:hypothetical protein SAMN06265795_1319 [Noviherbaspirillum humi]